MGKGNYVLHTIKLKSKDLRGLCNHNERKTENSSNPDIQRDLTSLNYELHRDTDEKIDYENDVKALISERYEGRKLRENTTFAVSFNISSGKEFFEGMSQEREREFFQANYDLIAEKYGKENIISARVHKDEETPHMHLVLVPFTQDNRLSAKELFDRGNLRELQDFALKLQEKGFDIERGKDAEGKNKHLETKLFKEIEKIHEVALVENIAFDKQKEVEPLKEKLQEFKKIKEEFEKYPSLSIDIEKYRSTPIDITPERKGLMGKETGNIIVDEKDFYNLKHFADKGLSMVLDNIDLKEKIIKTTEKNQRLEKELVDFPKLQIQNENLYRAFNRAMETFVMESKDDDRDEKFKKFFEKSLKSALYPMTKEDKAEFCKKIDSWVLGRDMSKSVQKVYGISTGKIKENSKGLEL